MIHQSQGPLRSNLWRRWVDFWPVQIDPVFDFKLRPVPIDAESAANFSCNRAIRTPFLRRIFGYDWKGSKMVSAELVSTVYLMSLNVLPREQNTNISTPSKKQKICTVRPTRASQGQWITTIMLLPQQTNRNDRHPCKCFKILAMTQIASPNLTCSCGHCRILGRPHQSSARTSKHPAAAIMGPWLSIQSSWKDWAEFRGFYKPSIPTLEYQSTRQIVRSNSLLPVSKVGRVETTSKATVLDEFRK